MPVEQVAPSGRHLLFIGTAQVASIHEQCRCLCVRLCHVLDVPAELNAAGYSRWMMNDGKYRSIFHSPMPPADAFRAARDEMRAWLRSKAYDLGAFDRGDPRVAPAAVLLHRAANSADGSQTERWELRESRDDGAWMSSLA